MKTQEQRAAYDKARRSTPEYKARRRSGNKTPEYRARQNAYKGRPEVKAREKAAREMPEAAARRKAYRDSPKEQARRKPYLLMRKYGISSDDYNAMFNSQGGCCLICNRHQIEFQRALAIDHDHETGEIRGLLCGPCNTGLGLFRDSAEILTRAIDYLTR